MAQPNEQAPAWVRELLPSREQRDALQAEAQAVFEAVQRGDRSSVIAFEWHLAELYALDRVEEP